MRGMARSWIALLVVGVVATAALAACGDDDDDSDTSGEAPGATRTADEPGDSTGVSDDEIRIGVVHPQSGPLGVQFLSFLDGVRARAAIANDNGGIGGRRLAIVDRDDGADVTRNLQVTREVVENERVFGILSATTAIAGSAEYLADGDVPVVGLAINQEWAELDNMFGYAGGIPASVDIGVTSTTWVEFLKERGATNLAILGSPSATGSGVVDSNADAAESIGLKVGYRTSDIPSGAGAAEIQADVERMKDAGVDSILPVAVIQTSLAAYQASVQSGLDLKAALLVTGYDQRLLDALGEQLEGVYIFVDFAPLELNLPVHETMRQAFADVTGDPEYRPGLIAVIGWLSTDAFIRGIEEAGDPPTRQGFIEGLRGVEGYTADGLLPAVDFEASFGMPTLCAYFVQVSGGDFVPVTDEPFCGEIVESDR